MTPSSSHAVKRYSLSRYPGNPCHTVLTPQELDALGRTSNHLHIILVYAKELAILTEWSVRVYDSQYGKYTHIVTCLGNTHSEVEG